jgi:hypothetical protein
MAYPNVDAPYGFIPQNLIGAQPYAGGTRQLPLGYASPTNIFNGDFVKLGAFGAATGAGLLLRPAVGVATTANQITGVFLGCSYTSPATKQKLWSQWWPSGTQAGDGFAYVADDPDLIFKAVALISGGGIGSFGYGSIGSNIGGVNGVGNPATGNSANGALVGSESAATLPFRVVGLVSETSIAVPVVGSSAALAVTVTSPGGLPRALPPGTDVSYLVPSGQVIRTGSLVAAAAAAGATAVTLNTAPALGGIATPIPAGSTIIFTIYPEVLVKINPGYHSYTTATAP